MGRIASARVASSAAGSALDFIFFFVAAFARRTVLHHLAIIFPESAAPANWLRAFGVFYDFAWTLTDSAVYRLLKKPFRYELEGGEFLDQLAAGTGAIVLTAHMGNYDLGSAVFVEKLHREIRMVRAPEPDSKAGAHLSQAIAESGGGGVKVAYNVNRGLLSFDLLNALRAGEIISIQGDRAMGDAAQFPVKMFNQTALLPSGPIVLALTAGVPIYPDLRRPLRLSGISIHYPSPDRCALARPNREKQILPRACRQWADVLGELIQKYWQQWHAFTPIFADQGNPPSRWMPSSVAAACDRRLISLCDFATASDRRHTRSSLTRHQQTDIPTNEGLAEEHPGERAEGEIRAKRQLGRPDAFADNQRHQSNDRTNHRACENTEKDCAPSEKCADGREKFQVAAAHGFARDLKLAHHPSDLIERIEDKLLLSNSHPIVIKFQRNFP